MSSRSIPLHRFSRFSGGRVAWFEHEVVNDKLNVMGKEIEQPGLAFRAFEEVVLGESDHWQTTARGVDPISAVG